MARTVRINGKPTVVYRTESNVGVVSYEKRTWRAATVLWLEKHRLEVTQQELRGEFGRADNITRHEIRSLKTPKQMRNRERQRGQAICHNGRTYRGEIMLREYRAYERRELEKLVEAHERAARENELLKRLHSATAEPSLLKGRLAACASCGWIHDRGFTQFANPWLSSEPIRLRGVLPKIVGLVHASHENQLRGLSSKDARLSDVCGGYAHPSKAFNDRGQRDAYKRLFDTSKRGFIVLRSPPKTK